MKKFELKFGTVKEMLTKEQMKQINGGTYSCVAVGSAGYVIAVEGDNCCQAQANCDSLAYSNQYTNQFPSGGDVQCDMAC